MLLLHPENRYHVREIARLTNTAPGTLHRELSKLAKVGILKREISGTQIYYFANRDLLIFNELVSILRKTSGIVDVLRNALLPLSNKIIIAFVFGSLARGTENPESDVDILIIGDVGFAEVVAALYATQEIIDREINPKVYQKEEWKKLIHKKDPFAQEILSSSKLFIIGEANDLKQFGWEKD